MGLELLLQDLAFQYGYFGVFLLSFLGASSVVVPIPYTVVLLFVGAYSEMDLTFLAVASGLGAALGEIVGYLLGRGARKAISPNKQKRLEGLLRILTGRKAVVPLIIFIFALTPLPDDLLFVPLGLTHYPLLPTLIPSFLGKFLMAYLIAYGGRTYNEFIISLLGREAASSALVLISVVSAVVLAATVVAILSVDWEALFARKTNRKQ